MEDRTGELDYGVAARRVLKGVPLAEGVPRGEFRPIGPHRFAARLRALLGGFSICVVTGLRGTDGTQFPRHVREFLGERLLADS